jgi:hypothetical protein
MEVEPPRRELPVRADDEPLIAPSEGCRQATGSIVSYKEKDTLAA